MIGSALSECSSTRTSSATSSKLPQVVAGEQVRESTNVAAVSVDSAWLRHCDSIGRGPGRHVNIVAGRATFADGPPKLYAYVHKEVTSARARLDQFLSRNGVAQTNA